jgi:hypothetical protein
MTEQVETAGNLLVSPFVGTWTYRSFVNDPDITPDIPADFGKLAFGRGELVIDDFAPGTFSGRIIFSDTNQFKLSGASSFGNPYTVRFRAVGDASASQGHIYDLIGYLVPIWPNGIDQRTVMVGSIVRTVPHNGDTRKAGFVASWIAMKRD